VTEFSIGVNMWTETLDFKVIRSFYAHETRLYLCSRFRLVVY